MSKTGRPRGRPKKAPVDKDPTWYPTNSKKSKFEIAQEKVQQEEQLDHCKESKSSQKSKIKNAEFSTTSSTHEHCCDVASSFKEFNRNFNDKFKYFEEHITKPQIVILHTNHENSNKVKESLTNLKANVTIFHGCPKIGEDDDKFIDEEYLEEPWVPSKKNKKFVPISSTSNCEVKKLKKERINLGNDSQPANSTINDEQVKVREEKTDTEVEKPKHHTINAWISSKNPKWIVKNSTALKEMMTKEGLISTYKCMEVSCSYTTIAKKNFKKHLSLHECQTKPNKNLYCCPYCFFKGQCCDHLIDHYSSYHQHDKFQCAFCFYRTADSDTCWQHGLSRHSNSLIYECPLEGAPFDEKAEARLQKKQKIFVKPLQCSTCNLKFFLVDQYDDHMKSHDINESSIDNKCFMDLKVFKERIDKNIVGRYQCLFCEFGTFVLAVLKKHMEEHPKEVSFFCTRQNAEKDADPHSIKSTVITKTMQRPDIEIIKFDLDLNTLRNTDNVNKFV